MNTMKVLADEFQGQVRFGYADFNRDELIKEYFGALNAPNTYLLWEGKVYEQKAFQLGYVPVR